MGVFTVIVVVVTFVTVAVALPKETLVVPPKPEPRIVTALPPVVGPEAGERPETMMAPASNAPMSQVAPAGRMAPR